MSDQLPILTRKKLQPKGPKPEDMVARPTENEEMREKEPPLAFEDFPVNKSINQSPSKPIEDPKETIREIEEGSKGGPNEPQTPDHLGILMPPEVSSKLFWINILVYLNVLFLLIYFPCTV